MIQSNLTLPSPRAHFGIAVAVMAALVTGHVAAQTWTTTATPFLVNGVVTAGSDSFFGPVPSQPTSNAITFRRYGWLNATESFTLNASRGILLTAENQYQDGTFISVAEGKTLSYGGQISGITGYFEKTGLGTLLLSSSDTYVGRTFIEAGTLILQNGDALGKGMVFASSGYSDETFGTLRVRETPTVRPNGGFIARGGNGPDMLGGHVIMENGASFSSNYGGAAGGNAPGAGGGIMTFQDTTNAGSSSLFVTAGYHGTASGGKILFKDQSSAGKAAFAIYSNNGGSGSLRFSDSSDAGSAHINNYDGAIEGGALIFEDNATAKNSKINNWGPYTSVRGGGTTVFRDHASAGNSFISNTTHTHGVGGTTFFLGNSTAGAATVQATDARLGAKIVFRDASRGGTASIGVFEQGTLDISGHDAPLDTQNGYPFYSDDEKSSVTIGSLEGDGRVFLGERTLTIGSNDKDTTFSGQISGKGGLVKIGTGTWTVASTDTYEGNTYLKEGTTILRNGNALGDETTWVSGGLSTDAEGATLRVQADLVNRDGRLILNHGFNVLGGAAAGALGGTIVLENGSSTGSVGGAAYGATVPGAGSGQIIFRDTARVGTGYFEVSGGVISFLDDSSAGAGIFVANSYPGTMGSISFSGNSGAGTAYLQNRFGRTQGGFTLFGERSSAEGSQIINEGADSRSSENLGHGTTIFSGDSTAGQSLISNTYGVQATGGQTQFTASSSAGSSRIHNEGAALSFVGEGRTGFSGEATAATSKIVNSGGLRGAGGATTFSGNATASSSQIQNQAGVKGGGESVFQDDSTARSSVILNLGDNRFGGSTFFNDRSTAGDATLEANGAVAGGKIVFSDDSLGGTSTVKVFDQGRLEIASHNPTGVTIGSLEGDGRVLLGGNSLTVGSNNKDTFFSGRISGEGGLTKIGNGQWVVASRDTYLGDTNINSGSVVLQNGNAFGLGSIQVGGGATPDDSGATLLVQSSLLNRDAADKLTASGGSAEGASGGAIVHENNATTGLLSGTAQGGAVDGAEGGQLIFRDRSQIGNGTFSAGAGLANGSRGGEINFLNQSSAGDGTLLAVGGEGGQGVIRFTNTASAGTASLQNLSGKTEGGFTAFNERATAANSQITNSGGNENQQGSGSTVFADTASAGRSEINNGSGLRAEGGFTLFAGRSTAGEGRISNEGGLSGTTDTSYLSTAGNLRFTNQATAGSSTIINREGSEQSGYTTFGETANAGYSQITNQGNGLNAIAGTQFLGSTSASFAKIENEAGRVSGGATVFHSNSTAASSEIQNRGSDRLGGAGNILFLDNASGGSSSIWNGRGTAQSGFTIFAMNSNAGLSAITNEASDRGEFAGLQFVNAANASSAKIRNGSGLLNGGSTLFGDSSSAATSVIENDGSSTKAGAGYTVFKGLATAGSSTILNRDGREQSGFTIFDETSTAGRSEITNESSGSEGVAGTQFYGSASAGRARIRNLGGDAAGGSSFFGEESTAGSSIIENQGANTRTNAGNTLFTAEATADSSIITNGAGTKQNGYTIFQQNSDAGHSEITNKSGGLTGIAGVQFLDVTSAGTATIYNESGALAGGNAFFGDSSSAAGSVINNGGSETTTGAGNTVFSNRATARFSTITNGAGQGQSGFTVFEDQATAGRSNITNQSSGLLGLAGTRFYDSAWAGFAQIHNQAGSSTLFNDRSSAASSVIDNHGANVGSQAGHTLFTANATAASSTITNGNGNLQNGYTVFAQNSDAGSSDITNEGGRLGTFAGAQFFDNATANSANISNQSGSLSGGSAFFGDSSSAATSVINNEGSETTSGAGNTVFTNSATSASSSITNGGGTAQNGHTTFAQESNAGRSEITNRSSELSGNAGTLFLDDASASSAKIHNESGLFGGGSTIFGGDSSAASSAIDNGGSESESGAGYSLFTNRATAGASTISNGSGTGEDGYTIFAMRSTAGRSEITNSSGGKRNMAGTQFFDEASAGSAHIHNENGSLSGGSTFFGGTSSAGTSVVDNAGSDTKSGAGHLVFTDQATAASSSITNGSGLEQNGYTIFNKSADAGDSGITNQSGGANGIAGLQFLDQASASAATIQNRSGARGGGSAIFRDTTSAASSIIKNEGSATTVGEGNTIFADKATAANSVITNGGGLGRNGYTMFAENSDAGESEITNQSGALNGIAGLQFLGRASAESAKILNTSGELGGGSALFAGTTSASSSIIDNEGSDTGSGAGHTVFTTRATAGSSSITNGGGRQQSGFTIFDDQSSAGGSDITNQNSGLIGNAGTRFYGLAIAGTAQIHNQVASWTLFDETSSAASSVIDNEGSATALGAGHTIFTNEATAAFSKITNGGGTERDGFTTFVKSSDAGSSEITNQSGGSDLTEELQFFDQASAGSATILNVNGDLNGGSTIFRDKTSAGSSSIDNEGSATAVGAGHTTFTDDATAASSTIINGQGTEQNGYTIFTESSDAGESDITNGSGRLGGVAGVQFVDLASAGLAEIRNERGELSGGSALFGGSSSGGFSVIKNAGSVTKSGAGNTVFTDRASAASSTITNGGGPGQSGYTVFAKNSHAGVSDITNHGGGADSVGTRFEDQSSAWLAKVNNLAGILNGGSTVFYDKSTAAGGIIENRGSATQLTAGNARFTDESSAGASKILNLGNANATSGYTVFEGKSNAGSSKITNRGGNRQSGPSTAFSNSASASAATIINLDGASVAFNDESSAGGSVIYNQGTGTETLFADNSKAGQSTLIATGDVDGGRIVFTGQSSGDKSRIVLTSGGSLDLRSHESGISVGSLEGNGAVLLGANLIHIGENERGTLFSGVILGADEPAAFAFNAQIASAVPVTIRDQVVKTGSEFLILAGANSYTGNTRIKEGALILNGSARSANIVVERAGSFGGNGIAFGNLISHGTVSPGNSPGLLSVGGDFTQANTGTFAVEIATPTAFDQLQVGGTAAISGKLQITAAVDYPEFASKPLTILTAHEEVVGTFDEIDQSLSLIFFKVGYLSNSITLTSSETRFASYFNALGKSSGFVLAPNQTAVARALDRVSLRAQDTLLFNTLLNREIGALPADFELIAPEELSAMFEVVRSASQTHLQNISDQLSAGRLGSRGFSSRLSLSDRDGKRTFDPKDGLAPEDIFTPSPDNKWGFWVGGSGEFVSVGNDTNAAGFDFETSGVTLGVDYQLSQNLILGLAASYSHANTDLINAGDIEGEGERFAIYGTWFEGSTYVNAVVGAGLNNFDSRRRGLEGFAQGETEGTEVDLLIGGGHDWTVGKWTLGPVASLGYTDSRITDFREAGSLAPLEISAQEDDSLRSRIGGHLGATFKLGTAIIRPEIRAEWQHDYLDDTRTIGANFQGNSRESFSVSGPRLGSDAAILGSGLSIQWSPAFMTYLNYEAEIGRDKFDRHTFSGGIRFEF